MNRHNIFMLILTVSLSTAFGHSYNIQEFILSSDSVDMMNLQTAGDYVVYSKMGMQAYGYQLSIRQEFQITQGGVTLEIWNLKMNSHYLVGGSMASPGLYGYDLDARQMFLIKSMDMLPMTIALSERYVYWADTADPMNPVLRGYDLIARQEFLVRENFMDSMSLKAAGNYAIWSENASTKGYGYDAATQDTFLIAENGFFDSMSTLMNDRYLIYRDMDNLYAYDLHNRQSFIVTTEDVDAMSLKLTSHFVIWKEMTMMKLWAYDLDTKQQHLITSSSTDPMLLANDKYVIWKDSGFMDLHNFSLQTLQNQDINTQFDIMMPVLSGDYLIWSQYNAETMLTSIEGYDLATEQPFTIAFISSGMPYTPAAVGDYVIWSDSVNTMPVLKGAQIFKLPNDLCTDAVSISNDIPYDGTTVGATGTDLSSCGFNDSYDVWNRYVPAAGGAVTISTDGSSFDTILSIYEGCGGNELACNDDYGLENPYSQIVLNAVKGKTYLIRIAGFDGQQGAYKLLVTRGTCANPPQSDTNNDCKVDMQDLAVLAAEWLHCGKSNPADCL
ncbi:MAG: hypothetical protein JXB18_10320 [Sedimentisphaerales bacterium]|nr:hypothetical protein [Sedimentisphaerales bacterium]